MNGNVLVTGASSGIGAATVRKLSHDGFNVFGTVRKTEDAATVEANGGTFIVMDVTDHASVAAAQIQIARQVGKEGLAALINNAGVPCAGPLELIPLVDIKAAFDVNVFGLISVTQVFLPLLKTARGRIVNVGSVSGRLAFPFIGPYAASKFAVKALTDCLRRELLAVGVDVLLVEPGSCATPIWDKIPEPDRDSLAGTVYEGVADRFRESAIKGGREGIKAERVAEAISTAVGARRPPVRTLVVASRLKTLIMESLPDRWLDALVNQAVWRRNSLR
jgi:NAD(P)-dependent dehydrogenase (short-subunit alcohol dehydrogenase family)